MLKKLFIRQSLINKDPQVVVHLAEDEYGVIAKDVHLGDISQSIPIQTAGVTIMGLMMVTYFREYIPGTYGGIIAYGSVFALGAIYWRVIIGKYRASCAIAMKDIIREYRHQEAADRRILRKVINFMRTDGRKSNDFKNEVRALFLKFKKDEEATQKEYDKIIKEASE